MAFKPLVLLLILCLACTVHAQAQIPLVIQIDGLVYRWSPGDDTPTPTGCDLKSNRLNLWVYTLTQSADGKWAAFMALPAEFMHGAPAATGNLWVCQIETGEAYALTEVDGASGGLVSEGVFSPDGTRIIWTDLVGDPGNSTRARMLVHDLSTHTTSTLVEEMPLTSYCGIIGGHPRLLWGKAGIVAEYQVLDGEPCSEESEAAPMGFAHYADDGTLLDSFLLPEEIRNTKASQWLDEPEPRIAFIGFSQTRDEIQLYSMDMTTGAVQTEDGVLEAFIPGAEDSGRLAWTDLDSFDNTNRQHMSFPGGQNALEASTDAALSSDGTTMAIVFGHTLYFADETGLTPVPWNETYLPLLDEGTVLDPMMGQVEVAWASPSYRLVPAPESLCPDVDPDAMETPAEADFRSVPFMQGEVIGHMSEGELPYGASRTINAFSRYFDARPVCADDMYWYQVIVGEGIGWGNVVPEVLPRALRPGEMPG